MDDPDDAAYARAPEPEDLIRICRALNDAGAQYVLIGGFAVMATVGAVSPRTSIPARQTTRPRMSPASSRASVSWLTTPPPRSRTATCATTSSSAWWTK